jgi:hypothetical protein
MMQEKACAWPQSNKTRSKENPDGYLYRKYIPVPFTQYWFAGQLPALIHDGQDRPKMARQRARQRAVVLAEIGIGPLPGNSPLQRGMRPNLASRRSL